MGKRITVYLTNEELEILEKLKKRLKMKNNSRVIKYIIRNYKCNTKSK